MKLTDHVEHIRKLIDTAFRNRLGRMGVASNSLQPVAGIPIEYHADRTRIENIREVWISETGTPVEAFEKLVEEKTMNPLFVTRCPKELVPLAKQNAANPSVVDVYELVINGQEISPGYSELNDPDVQRQRLEHQSGGETQKLDEDFLTTLEYGMPPAGGIGIGIDRLVMMLTGVESIRDVILFPHMRPRAGT
jgi:lysyl-tRNA synthetase class II